LLIALSCKKEYSYEGSGIPTIPVEPPIGKGSWEFKEASLKYAGPVDTAFLTKEDRNRVLRITGKTPDGKQQLLFTIISPTPEIETKTYSTTQTEVKFLYQTSNKVIYSAVPYRNGDMYVTITEIDSKHVKGTFKGLVIDSVNKTREIVDGHFVAPLKVITGSGATGRVMLWAVTGCNGAVKVRVNNQPGEIRMFSSSAPLCGDEGTASYILSPGEYGWVAYCGIDSVVGKVLVKADSCSKVLVDFPFRPAPSTETKNDSCRVKSINSSGTFSYSINADFENDIARIITFPVDVYRGFVFSVRHYIEYTSNEVKVHDNEYFVKDASGKVIEHHGFLSPDNWNAQKVIIKYTYSGNHLLRATIHRLDQSMLREVNFSWNNGNLTKVRIDFLTSGTQTEYLYDYYSDKDVRGFPYIVKELPELLFYQSALNIGSTSKNAVKNFTWKSYDQMGRVITNQKYFIEGYVIDANNYVVALTMREGSSYSNITHFSFSYYCF
jgi:hypothetical protein